MNRNGFHDTEMFIGMEVEHTPAYNLKTLFVVGNINLPQILAAAFENEVEHVFLGANHSYDHSQDYNATIIALLKSFAVTLEYPSDQQAVLAVEVWSNDQFIPLISVRMGSFKYNKNTIVKVDDIDFAATNDGVWCMPLGEFTSWDAYDKDRKL